MASSKGIAPGEIRRQAVIRRVVVNSTDLVRVIEREGRQLVGGLFGELKVNLGTSYYRVLGEDEFFERVYAVYQRLAQWLVSKDDAPIQSAAEESGKERFSEGIPLGQVVLALMLMERHLWNYLDSSARQVDENLRSTVIDYFQKTVYSTARGYEAKLAESNRLSRRTAAGQGENVPLVGKASTKPPASIEEPKEKPQDQPKDNPKDEHDLEVSRGGQVGELGG